MPKVLVFALAFLAPAQSNAERKELVEQVKVDNRVFLEDDKFVYFEESLDISMELQKRADITSLSGVLLSITSNDNVAKTLIIDWVKDRATAEIILLGENNVSKFQLVNSQLFTDSTFTFVHLLLDFRKDSLSLNIGDQTVRIGGLNLSAKKGYKFAILPVLSERKEANTAPTLRIENLSVLVTKPSLSRSIWYWYVIIIAVDVLIFLVVHVRRRRRRAKLKRAADTLAQEPTSESLIATPKVEVRRKSTILLLGGLQVFDREGEDIAKRFSPLLKELLCLILIHSAKKGISSDQLTEQLWFDKDRVSAKNNRSVNIGKLRTLLDQVGSYELSNETGYWKLESTTIFVDYLELMKLRVEGGKPTKEQLDTLLMLSSRGNLLPEVSYDWLDSFKSYVSDFVIESLWAYASTLNIEKSPELTIEIADRIFGFEHINEQALYLKCKAYSVSGRHSSAKKTYDKFCSDYLSVYGEAFPVSFTDMINREPDWGNA